MKQEGYKLANQIRTEEIELQQLDEITRKKHKLTVLDEIKREKKRNRNRKKKLAVAAACVGIGLGGVLGFSDEVHAAIEQIRFTLSEALGLKQDLAQYKEVVNSSVTDSGYQITLQEVVAAEKRLLISYTIQREDGQPIEEGFYVSLWESLWINGKQVYGGGSGSMRFLDETHTIMGVEKAYDTDEFDLASENDYEWKLEASENGKGEWDFQFTANGFDLMADTKRMTLGNEFYLPNGTILTLDELVVNDLEQRINVHSSGDGTTDYNIKLIITDEQERNVEFYISRFSNVNGFTGYMLNAENIENGRIAPDAQTISATLYAVELPKEDGRIPNEYVQVGETVRWDLTQLK